MISYRSNGFTMHFPICVRIWTAAVTANGTHTGEDGCAVAAAVEQGLASEERWESFCRMYGELKAKKPY